MSPAGPTRGSSSDSVRERDRDEDRAQRYGVLGYVTSRFPKLTETFILYELLGLERAGSRVEFYPLLRENAPVVHPEAKRFVDSAHFLPFLSWSIVKSQLYLIARAPRNYLKALIAVLRGTWGTANFFIGGIGIFPKVAHASRLMKAQRVSHVHCHFATHAATAGFIIHRLSGIPFSFTAQGSDLHIDRRMLCEKIGEAAFVIAISEYNRRVIIDECGEGRAAKVHVVHSGVDTEFFRPQERRRKDSRFSILCVGTLHEVKGQRYLLEACRTLNSEAIDFSCRLVGNGPDRAALAAQIEAAGLTGRVELVGALPREEVAELLHTSDVLVAPSVPTREGRREGIPIVLMEALACGVPVISSAISGIPEIVIDGETGILTPPGDAPALAGALRRLHADDDFRLRLGAGGRAKVVEEFDAFRNAATLARLCSESRPGPAPW